MLSNETPISESKMFLHEMDPCVNSSGTDFISRNPYVFNISVTLCFLHVITRDVFL